MPVSAWARSPTLVADPSPSATWTTTKSPSTTNSSSYDDDLLLALAISQSEETERNNKQKTFVLNAGLSLVDEGIVTPNNRPNDNEDPKVSEVDEDIIIDSEIPTLSSDVDNSELLSKYNDDDASLALATQLSLEDEEQYETFKRQNNNGDRNSGVQVSYYRATHPAPAQVPIRKEIFGADDVDRFNNLYGSVESSNLQTDSEQPLGFQMNANKDKGTVYKRVGNTVLSTHGISLGTKHDIKLSNIVNSNRLNISEDTTITSKTYNAFKKNLISMSKGVSSHAHGRAGGRAKTVEGGIDDAVRKIIKKGIDSGIIDELKGKVKEGKEGQIFYASSSSSSERGVAVKVFKRIQEFRNRGSYVNGDPRFFKKFDKASKRDQLSLWCEKEYRNLTRCFLAGVACPRPIAFKSNVLFMNFFSGGAEMEDIGWPAPSLKELESQGMIKSEKKVKAWYCEVFTLVRRLYICAQLVHGDLSEYNLLLVSSKAVRAQINSEFDVDIDGETAMKVGKRRIILIDMAQSVTVHHPDSSSLLKRDIMRVNSFFSKFIDVVGSKELMAFITGVSVGVDEDWVDLGEDEGSGDDFEVEGGEVGEEVGSGEVDIGDIERLEVEGRRSLDESVSVDESATTSVLKGEWRFRKAFNDAQCVVEIGEMMVKAEARRKEGGGVEEEEEGGDEVGGEE